MHRLPYIHSILRLLTALALISGMVLILTPAQTVNASNFVVTRFDDPAPNGCAVGGCSLREAILDANANGGPDTVTLPAGTFTLTRAGSDDNGQLGDLDITGDLTLTGAGAASTTVTISVSDRLFHVLSATVTISGLTISGGNQTQGAGLYHVGGKLTLSHLIFTQNNAGGVGGGVNSESGLLIVTESAFTGNTGGAAAGGLFINSGTFTVSNSSFTSNNADTGGGLFVSADAAGTVSASTFSANTGNSAGLHNSGALTVTDSLLANNVVNASAGGGGMGNSFGTLTVINTTIRDNTAGEGGGINNFRGTVHLSGSALIGNTGGGLNTNAFSSPVNVFITNTTFSGNTVNGGISNVNLSVISLNNVTLTGNSRSAGFGSGGITNSGTFSLRNSIVAGNSTAGGAAPDCFGNLTSLGHNLIGNVSDCGFSATGGDLTGFGAAAIDPKLVALQNNGGSTQTHALRADSPALEAGDNVSCAPTDQRGQPRPLGVGASPVCDMGSFERGVANMALSMQDTPDPVKAGSPVTYTIQINNSGPNLASGVTITDTLPSSAVFNSATSSQGGCSAPAGGVLTCALGLLKSGESATVAVIVTPNSQATLNNTATVSANESDVNKGNNIDSETTALTGLSDPALSMSDAPDPALVGAPLTYTLNVLNGTLVQTNARVTDTLPVNVAFGSVSTTAGTCSGASVIVCNLGTLSPNRVITITISVTPIAAGLLTNSALLTTNEDGQTGNNSTTTLTTVNTSANLSLTLTDSADPADASLPYTYTVAVLNAGPSPARHVTVTDVLPFGVTLNAALATQGSCSGATTVVCSLGTLARRSAVTVTLQVIAPNFVGTINNTASTTSDEPDPDPSNNSESEATDLRTSVDLTVTQSDSPDPVISLGSLVTYTVTVKNLAPLLSASNVTLVNTLSAGLTIMAATSSQGACATPDTQTAECALGSLGAGKTAIVTLTAQTSTAASSETSTANVDADEFDPNLANNTDVEVTKVEVTKVGFSLFLPLLRR